MAIKIVKSVKLPPKTTYDSAYVQNNSGVYTNGDGEFIINILGCKSSCFYFGDTAEAVQWLLWKEAEFTKYDGVIEFSNKD